MGREVRVSKIKLGAANYRIADWGAERVIVADMGLINRLFGKRQDQPGSGDDSAPQPPALPKFDYELMYVRGKDAVRRALELRQEGAGIGTPVIIGTQKNFSHLTDLWGEEEFAATTP